MGPGTSYSQPLLRACFYRAMTALVLVLVSACGSGSSSGSSTDTPPASPPAGSGAPELSGVSPTSLVFDLQTDESASATMTFANSGDAALSYELTTAATWISLPGNASGTVVAGASVNLSLNVTCGAADVSGSLALVTNDADEANISIPVSATCTTPASAFQIARVLLNQGARGFDSILSDQPGIRIIAGREMVVRAFVTGSGPSPDARVVVARPGQADFTIAMQTPLNVGAAPVGDATLNASHYVVLPGSAIQQDTTLRVEVAPFADPVSYPASGGITLTAQDPGAFEITFVPVTYQGQTPSISTTAYMREVLKVLPIGDVSVDVRTPYTFTGAFDLEDVLMEISDLRDLDGSNRLYHAVIIPPADSSSPTAGVAFVGYPVSVSVDLGGASFVVAHELGHNLSLGHAPGCDAPNADANFPYANGAVTSWGFDTVNNTLVAPAAKSDFMSYCNDQWVSDYHFNQAIEFRSQSPLGFAPPVARGLFISGRFEHDHVTSVRMMPTARVSMPIMAEQANHDYRFMAWDSNGAEVVNQPFSVRLIEDLYDTTQAFMFSVPAPHSRIDHYEIRHLDRQLFTQRLTPVVAAPSPVDLVWGRAAAQIHWSPLDGDALVLRNMNGRVVTVDRTGSFTLAGDDDLTIELVSQGLPGNQTSVAAGRDHQLLLTR